MIVTIAEHFTSDPSDRERSPTIIWKPGFKKMRNSLNGGNVKSIDKCSFKPSFHMIVDDRYDRWDRCDR